MHVKFSAKNPKRLAVFLFNEQANVDLFPYQFLKDVLK